MPFTTQRLTSGYKRLFALLATAALLVAALLVAAQAMAHIAQAAPAAQPPVTTITVDTTADLNPDSSRFTCNFTIGSGALTKAADDGKCTLRRAINEASTRPSTDRPILIEFNIPLSDTGYLTDTDSLADTPYVAGTWLISVAESLPALSRENTLELNGEVTIDGSTQPGGRSDGPPIIIDTDDFGLEIESTDNVIRSLAFYNGGSIQVKEDRNVIENIWMGLTTDGNAIKFRTPGQFNRMAFGGILLRSNGNAVRDSVLSGAFGRAVSVDGGDNNVIENNRIGTRSDGTIPFVDPAIRCVIEIENPDDPFAFYYNPDDWYGGWGIQTGGTGTIVRNNLLAGMNNVRSANDTPPMALEVFGNNQQIISNTIGVDAVGYGLGVCGQAIKFSGYEHDVLDNVIVGASPFNPDDPNRSALLANDTSPLFDRITVRRNIVRDGETESTQDLYEFGPGLPEALRLYRSARITDIEGPVISGGNGIDIIGGEHPCPFCEIDIYLDDDDERNEALEYLGTATSDFDGNFTFTLPVSYSSGLTETQGLHTISNSTEATLNVSQTHPMSDSVVFDYSAGMSFEASKLFLPMRSVEISGTLEGLVGNEYSFLVDVDPSTATSPFIYSYTATDQEPGSLRSQNSQVTLTYRWFTTGTKTISLTVENDLGTMTDMHTIQIVDELGATPTPTPAVTGTPSPMPSGTPSTPAPSGTPSPLPSGTPVATPNPTATPGGSFGDEGNIFLPVVTKP